LTPDGRTKFRVHVGRNGASGCGRHNVWCAQAGAGKIGGERVGAEFLHAAELEFRHPRTGEAIAQKSELPQELLEFLRKWRSGYNDNQMTRGFTSDIFSRSSILEWAAVLLLVVGAREFGVTQASAAEPRPSSSSSLQSSTPSSQPAAGSNAAPQNSGGQDSNDSGAENGDIPKIRVGTNEVNVVFTVTDKHGKRVTDLKQADFHFVDDNRPVADIRSFHAETNLPLQVGLLIDASASVRDRFKFEQESAIEFLNQTVRKRYDEAFVVGFDVTPEVTQDFTDDTEKLAHGVRELRPGAGRRCTTRSTMRAATSC